MKKPKNHAKPLGKPNGKIADKPRQKKAVGHDKRVSALKSKGKVRETVEGKAALDRVSDAVRTAPDRIRKRKPAYDGTPNYTPEKENPPTSPFVADSPITIDADLAAAQLEELANLHADVLRAAHIAEEKKEAASTAKKTVESKTGLLMDRLRAFTHPPSLPLFDQQVESRAVTRMAQGEPVGNQLDLSGDAAAQNTDDDEETQPETEPEPAPA